MLKETKLKTEARQSAVHHGHNLTRFRRTIDGNTHEATCRICKAYVIVRLRPKPNEIDVSGPAVAVSCRKHKRDERAKRRIRANVNEAEAQS
jgi:hypothetical protein